MSSLSTEQFAIPEDGPDLEPLAGRAYLNLFFLFISFIF